MSQQKKKNDDVPEDVKESWFNVIRACQAASRGNRGYAILTMRVAIGPKGDPVLWYIPDIEKLSPLGVALDNSVHIDPGILAALAKMASS